MGQVILNIGLDGPIPQTWALNLGVAARMLLLSAEPERVEMFFEPPNLEEHPGEPTLVARVSNMQLSQVAALCADICEATMQDCIAVKVLGPQPATGRDPDAQYDAGYLFGPRPDKWLPFDESKFINWRT